MKMARMTLYSSSVSGVLMCPGIATMNRTSVCSRPFPPAMVRSMASNVIIRSRRRPARFWRSPGLWSKSGLEDCASVSHDRIFRLFTILKAMIITTRVEKTCMIPFMKMR